MHFAVFRNGSEVSEAETSTSSWSSCDAPPQHFCRATEPLGGQQASLEQRYNTLSHLRACAAAH